MTCFELSTAADEPLAGTATHTERFLLLEVRSGWGRDPVADSGLSDAVLRHLEDWLARVPASRVQFVRRPDRRNGPIAVHRVDCGDGERVVRFDLERLDDIVALDLDTAGAPVSVPLALVCTHGRRDACCARIGVPVFDALRAELGADADVWHSSHQGGHRFAGNVLVLPQAVQLGRVTPGDAPTVAAAIREQRIPLAFFRGRTIHPPRAQAADAAVRAERGLEGLDAVSLTGSEGDVVRLSVSGATVDVRVTEQPGPTIPLSCGVEAVETTTFETRIAG